MKSLLSLLAITAATGLLSGCNLEGDALLGKDPAEKTEIISSSYDTNPQKRLTEVSSMRVANCNTPDRVEDFLASVTVDDSKLILEFDPIWGSQYPTIKSIQFESVEFGYPFATKLHPGTCKIVSAPEARQRKYACGVEDVKHSALYLHRIAIANEACDASTTYESRDVLPGRKTSYSMGSYELYWGQYQINPIPIDILN